VSATGRPFRSSSPSSSHSPLFRAGSSFANAPLSSSPSTGPTSNLGRVSASPSNVLFPSPSIAGQSSTAVPSSSSLPFALRTSSSSSSQGQSISSSRPTPTPTTANPHPIPGSSRVTALVMPPLQKYSSSRYSSQPFGQTGSSVESNPGAEALAKRYGGSYSPGPESFGRRSRFSFGSSGTGTGTGTSLPTHDGGAQSSATSSGITPPGPGGGGGGGAEVDDAPDAEDINEFLNLIDSKPQLRPSTLGRSTIMSRSQADETLRRFAGSVHRSSSLLGIGDLPLPRRTSKLSIEGGGGMGGHGGQTPLIIIYWRRRTTPVHPFPTRIVSILSRYHPVSSLRSHA